jgi:hypothetical protein
MKHRIIEDLGRPREPDENLEFEPLALHVPDLATAVLVPIELEKDTGFDCCDFAIRPHPKGGFVITYDPD